MIDLSRVSSDRAFGLLAYRLHVERELTERVCSELERLMAGHGVIDGVAVITAKDVGELVAKLRGGEL